MPSISALPWYLYKSDSDVGSAYHYFAPIIKGWYVVCFCPHQLLPPLRTEFNKNNTIGFKYKMPLQLHNFISFKTLDVGFSYCWINLEVLKYSLEQYIGFVGRHIANSLWYHIWFTPMLEQIKCDIATNLQCVFQQNQCTVPENTSRLQGFKTLWGIRTKKMFFSGYRLKQKKALQMASFSFQYLVIFTVYIVSQVIQDQGYFSFISPNDRSASRVAFLSQTIFI